MNISLSFRIDTMAIILVDGLRANCYGQEWD